MSKIPLYGSVYRFGPQEPIATLCLSSTYYTQTGQFYLDGVWWPSAIHCYYAKKFIQIPIKDVLALNVDEILNLLSANPSDKLWGSISISIMRRILYTKIEQNIQYYRFLMELPMSAIDSIIENIDNIDLSGMLFHIRRYYNDKNHPLINPKNGKLNSRVSKQYDSWKLKNTKNSENSKNKGWKKTTV